jgi:putative transcriptional regulator
MGRNQGVRNHVRRHRRAIDGLTQEGLAERVGVTRQTIISIERGNYDPSVGLALRLARALGVPVEDLFEIDPEEDHG